MAESKSTKSARAEARRRWALANIQLRERCDPSASRAWGTLAQLRAAGHVPPDLAIDEQARIGAEWTDEAGRRCVLRPYARHQWEARRLWLPHERDELKRIEEKELRERLAQSAREREIEEHRRDLAARAQRYPKSVADYRRDVAQFSELLCSALLREIDGTANSGGCSVDEDSQDEIRAAIASIEATLAAATYRHDPRCGARLRGELAAFDAGNDEQLQAMLRAAQDEAAKRVAD